MTVSTPVAYNGRFKEVTRWLYEVRRLEGGGTFRGEGKRDADRRGREQ